MVEDTQNLHKKKCERCSNPWFPKPEGFGFSQYCFTVVEKKEEVDYNQENNPKKYFCVNCIPLVEKNYRDKKFTINRHKYRDTMADPIYQDKANHHLWSDYELANLNVRNLTWEEKRDYDPNFKEGWYKGFQVRFNFYDIYQSKRCQTCQEPLDEPKEKECCQKSQEIISQQKGKEDNSREREREREREQIWI